MPTFAEKMFETSSEEWRSLAAAMRKTHATKAEWYASHYERLANAIERDMSYVPEPDSEWLLGGA